MKIKTLHVGRASHADLSSLPAGFHLIYVKTDVNLAVLSNHQYHSQPLRLSIIVGLIIVIK
jgi:hypothetical protein